MKKIFFFILLFFIILSANLYSQNISVVNIQYLIDSNPNYNEILKKIEQSQDKHLEKFKKKEIELKKFLDDIENSKLILSENEINLQIDNYNTLLTDYTKHIEKFNTHYQNQIIIIRENILKEIIVLLEEYAIENSIDLIFDSTTYLIASNSLDITNIINNKLIQENLDLEYKDFE